MGSEGDQWRVTVNVCLSLCMFSLDCLLRVRKVIEFVSNFKRQRLIFARERGFKDILPVGSKNIKTAARKRVSHLKPLV